MTDQEETNAAPVKIKRLMKPKKQRKLAARERRARQTRARRILVKLGVFAGMPTVVAAIYFGFVASDIYQSSAVIMIQSAAGSVDGTKGGLGKVVRAGNDKDAAAIKEYIRSRDMLALLEEELQITAHYSQPQADCWSRLASAPTFEEAISTSCPVTAPDKPCWLSPGWMNNAGVPQQQSRWARRAATGLDVPAPATSTCPWHASSLWAVSTNP